MSRVTAVRLGLIALGALLLARGAWVAVATIPSVDRIHVVIWFALGVVVHDGLLAPFSVLLGRLALPHLPVSGRWAARALLAWAAAVLIIGLPLVHQSPRRANPTIEFGHPFVGLCVAMALGVAVVAVIQTALTVRRMRMPSTPAGSDDSVAPA
jgi:fucose 4-O-acetylase-like acetyltransferase